MYFLETVLPIPASKISLFTVSGIVIFSVGFQKISDFYFLKFRNSEIYPGSGLKFQKLQPL